MSVTKKESRLAKKFETTMDDVQCCIYGLQGCGNADVPSKVPALRDLVICAYQSCLAHNERMEEAELSASDMSEGWKYLVAEIKALVMFLNGVTGKTLSPRKVRTASADAVSQYDNYIAVGDANGCYTDVGCYLEDDKGFLKATDDTRNMAFEAEYQVAKAEYDAELALGAKMQAFFKGRVKSLSEQWKNTAHSIKAALDGECQTMRTTADLVSIEAEIDVARKMMHRSEQSTPKEIVDQLLLLLRPSQNQGTQLRLAIASEEVKAARELGNEILFGRGMRKDFESDELDKISDILLPFEAILR